MGKHANPHSPKDCERCSGAGEIKIGNNGSSQIVSCSTRHGSGKIVG